MNIDPALRELIVCPACHAPLEDGGRGARVHRVRAGLPGARRHPGAARRRGPQAGLTPGLHAAPTWFDESRLDDETVLDQADASLRQLAESGARVRREAVEAESALDRGRRHRPRAGPAPRRGRRRPRLPAAAGRPRAVVPGALRRLAEPGTARLGRRSRPGRRARPRRRGRRYGVRGRRGRTSRVPGRRRRAARGRWWREHAAGRWSSILPTTARDQLATAVLVLEYLDRVDLGPSGRPRAGRRGPRPGGHVVLPAPRHRGEPRQDAGDRAGRRQPGRVGRLGARRPRGPPGRRVDPPGQRPDRHRRRRRAPAAGHRGRRRRATCSTTRSPTSRPSSARFW